MRLRPAALGASLSALACSSAFAQGIQASTTPRDLGFGAQVLVLYDSNSARSGKAIAQQRALSPEDVTVTPTVNVRFSQPIGRQTLSLAGSAGYQFHQRNKSLDRQYYDVNGGVATIVGFCQASLNGFYRASQADLNDLSAVNTKNLRSSFGPTVSLACGRPSGIGANLSVSRLQNRNSERSIRVSDSDIQSVSAGVGYGNPTLGRYGVTYSYSTSEFPNRIIPGRPIGDGFFNESIGVTGQRDFGRMSLNLAASRFTLKREFAPPGANQKLTGATYGGTVSYGLGSRISLMAGAARSIQPSGRPGKLYDIAKTANASVGYDLGSRIKISLGYTYADVTSNRDTLTPLLVVTSSRLSAATAGVDFVQSQVLTFGLTARYEERKTNLPAFDYNATSIGFRAGASF